MKKYLDENGVRYLWAKLLEKISALSTRIDRKADKSSIPTKVSQLSNDRSYLQESTANSKFATKSQLDGKADKSSVPSKVSQLSNDSHFITQSAVESKYATKSQVGSYITQSSADSRYAPKVIWESYSVSYDNQSTGNSAFPYRTYKTTPYSGNQYVPEVFFPIHEASKGVFAPFCELDSSNRLWIYHNKSMSGRISFDCKFVKK